MRPKPLIPTLITITSLLNWRNSGSDGVIPYSLSEIRKGNREFTPSDPEFLSILCGRYVFPVHACSHTRSAVDIPVLSRSVSKVSSDRAGSFRVCEGAANAGFHLGTRRICG